MFRTVSAGRFLPALRSFRATRCISSFTSTASGLAVRLTPSSEPVSFPYVWLRDSCQCSSCIHPSTRQKLHSTSDISPSVQPSEVKLRPGQDGPVLSIQWDASGSIRKSEKGGHVSEYSTDFLSRYSSPPSLSTFHRDVGQVSWSSPEIKATPDLFLEYSSLKSPRTLLTAIDHLSRYGLLFITGVPHRETSNETAELGKLARMFSEIRETFYGPLWDVRNIRDSKNIAYTDLDLGLHMDLLYFQHPPRYQFLHNLRNRVRGGTSIFVDALRAAEDLRETSSAAFRTLVETPVAFHYLNDGHHLHYSHPTIALSPFTDTISHINYSPPFQAPLAISTPPEFYTAFGEFAGLLGREGGRYEYTLREGDAVVFDNRRVLHARTAFEPLEDAGEGETRWLKGCYVEADAVMDRRRVLQRKAESGDI